MSLLCMGCNTYSAAPDRLIGVWSTTQGHYAQRPFVIQKDSILFIQGSGPDEFLHCPISTVKEEKMEDRTLYTIEYSVRGTPYSLAFFYKPAKGGRIRFKNQTGILWTIAAPTERIRKILSSLARDEPGSYAD